MNEPKPPTPGAANRPAVNRPDRDAPNQPRQGGAPQRPQQGAVGVGQLRQHQTPAAGQPVRKQGPGLGQRPGQRRPGQQQGQQPAGQAAAPQRPMKRPPSPPIRLETENYIVRSMLHSDVNEDYRDWTHDQEIMAGVNSAPTSMTLEDMHKYVDRFDNRNSFHFGIFDKHANNKLIGFYVIYRDRRHNLAQTNVVIGNKDYWGKQVVLETRSAVLDFLFEVVKVGKIWGNPMVRNIRSVFNYKAQGFVAEGVLRRHRIDPDGNRVDQVMFGLLPEDWAKQKRLLAEGGKLPKGDRR
jgi:RimJ/RimL family protein N-acetyltransferase